MSRGHRLPGQVALCEAGVPGIHLNHVHYDNRTVVPRRYCVLIIMVCHLQLILCERATRTFLADTGKKTLSSIIVKARKVRQDTHT